MLADYGVKAQLTTTQRVGIHKYTYPTNSENQRIILDMIHGIYNYDGKVLWTNIRVENDTLVTGYRITNGWARTNYTYFAMSFSKPITHYGCEEKAKVNYRGGYAKFNMKENFPDIGGRKIVAYFDFDPKTSDELEVKVALSGVSTEGALKNLRAEASGADFDQLAAKASDTWNKALSVIDAKGSDDQLAMLYTSLYHTMINPCVYTDVDGQYRGLDHNIHQADGFTNYTVFSVWDTYRALHPLFNIINRQVNTDIAKSMLKHCEQSVHHALPIWSHMANENWCMIGYHSVSVLADAIAKGLPIDKDAALKAMISSSTIPYYEGTKEFMELGYVPLDRNGSAGSLTLEYAYDDWTIYNTALLVGNRSVADTYKKRASNYANVFDTSIGYARPRYTNGKFKEDFSLLSTHGEGFIEGNALNYSFYVPQDVNGMIQLMGGEQAFITKMDSLFTMHLPDEFFAETEDVTKEGLLGGYVHGNEPSHHIPFLYAWTSQPWKTQFWQREIMNKMYRNNIDGLCGNDDCGQMSAWYILSSLGFYSVCPGSNQFILTTPLFDKANMKLGNGKTLVITANQPDKNKYITKVTLNGEEISHCYITYDQLMQGGTLDFTLSATPDKRWGTAPEYAPYSYTEQPTVSIPYIANDLDLFEGEITAELKSTTPEAVIHYTLDGSEPDENAPVYSEPFVLKETTIIKAKGYKKGFVPSRTYSIQATKAVLRPALSIQPTKHGVAYTYYEGEFQWVADLQKAKEVESGTIPEPSILNAKLPDHFGYIFTGYIYAPEDGVYEFSTRSDDGSVLYIGKEKVVDNDASHAAIDAMGRIPLQKGYHPFALHYFEDYEGEYLGWSWRTPSMSKLDAIPTENLYIN